MKEKILADLKNAMKQQDKETLSVLRMVKGALQLEEIKVKRDLKEEEVLSLISHEIKTRKESIKEFEKGNRNDLIEQTAREITILEQYLPEQLTEAEIRQELEIVLQEVKPVGIKDMGKVMGILSNKLKGKADLGLVSTLVKQALEQ